MFHKLTKKANAKRVVFLVVLNFALIFNQFQFYENKLIIDVLDVGQGDAILITTPDHKRMLIDGGPDSKVLSELGQTLPLGVNRIDVLLLTHPDLDHVGGFPEVVERYDIGHIYMVDLEEGNKAYLELKTRVKEKNISTTDIDEFEDFTLGCCVFFDIFWPKQNYIPEAVSRKNNLSVAFEVSYGKFNAFFAGDLDGKYETKIQKENPMDVDMLKVSHHGSKTSSKVEFISSIKPEVSIISAGKDNQFGHPHPIVIEALEGTSEFIFNTAEEGSIQVKTDGEKMWF